MMIATCRGSWSRVVLCIIKRPPLKMRRIGAALDLRCATPASAGADRLDQCFHVTEVMLQRATSLVRDAVVGARHAVLERLRAAHVLRLLELAGVHAQIAVRRV